MKYASEAEKRVGVQIHAMVYAVAIVVMVVINLLVGPPYWVLWVVPGWTIGLLCHWYFVLGPGARRT